MSQLDIRQALELRLQALDTNFTTIGENTGSEPPTDSDTPYQESFFMPNLPDNSVQGTTQFCERGLFQVSLKYPLGQGSGASAAQAELVRQQFKRGTTLTRNGVNVLITLTPQIAKGFVDGPRWHVPITISWQAWVPVA